MTGRQVERNNAIDSMNDAQLASTPMYSDTLGLYNTRMNNSDQSNTEEKTDKQTLEGEHDRPIYRVTTYDGFPGTNDRSKKEIEVYDREKFIKALDPFKNGSTKQQLINLDGKEKVLKFGNSKHVQTEVLTAKLYKEVGAPTLNVDLIEVCGGDEKRLALISDYVPTPNDGKTLEPKLIELRNSPDFRRHVAADMIFANWNMCEKNNWIEVDSRMLRADTGGALDFCAQGSNEKKGEFNADEVPEIERMNNGPYKGLTNTEIADSIRTIYTNLTEDKIDRAMEEAHYPIDLRDNMKKTLISRMKKAFEWADKHYPVETHDVDYTASSRRGSVSESSESGSSIGEKNARRLEQLGHSDLAWMPLFGEGFLQDRDNNAERIEISERSSSPTSDASALSNSNDELPMEFLDKLKSKWLDFTNNIFAGKALRISSPEVKAMGADPLRKPPMVGPEEILNDRQLDSDMREALRLSIQRMKGGVLIRRISDGEKEAFVQAAKSRDINEITSLLCSKRGEAVFSVNEIYTFKREKKREQKVARGDALTIKEQKQAKEDVSNYKWIIEIPITDGVLEFFADRAYISNPKEGSKPAAFANNPNAKFEGQADPRRNRDGIANVVLKKSGFAFFWEQVGQLRFYEDSKHISQNNSLDPEALREERIARKKEEGKEARAVRENMASENIENGDIILDCELFVDNDY